MQPVSQEIAQSVGLPAPRGIQVRSVQPTSTASNGGIKAGDILFSVNGIETNDFEAFRHKKVSGIYEGDKVTYEVYRDGKTTMLKAEAVGRAYESDENYVIEYGAIPFDKGQIRSIVTKPVAAKSQKLPAVLFIPGYTCASIDNLPPLHPYRKIVYSLTEKGYLVMRAEKPGLGDCMNTPECYDIDFATEVKSFKTALQALQQRQDVDKDNIFILGHSMGGMEAPFVAEGENVKGIIAMGITIKPWMEYLTEMLRNQNPNMGIDYVQNEKDMKLYERLLYALHVEGKSPSEMVKENAEFDRIMRRDFNYHGGNDFLTRDIIFSRSIHAHNIVEAWANTSTHVLSAWGEADVQVINDFSHRELVKIVNNYHPGKATFLKLDSTDHNFLKIGTIDDSYAAYRDGTLGQYFSTSFNNEVIGAFDDWMKLIMRKED